MLKHDSPETSHGQACGVPQLEGLDHHLKKCRPCHGFPTCECLPGRCSAIPVATMVLPIAV